MSEIKRTPGLYTAGVGRSLGLNIIGVFSSPSKVVAICGEQGAEDEDESIGNAFLFAAAPEMYHALKTTRAYLENIDEGGLSAVLELLDSAIAKAEGGEVEG